MGIEMCEKCGEFIDTDVKEMFESLNEKYDCVCESCSQNEYDEQEEQENV